MDFDMEAKRERDEINATREAEKQTGIAERKAARKPAINRLRKVAVSRGFGEQFDKTIAEYGEAAVLENKYVRSLAMGHGYEMENGRFLF